MSVSTADVREVTGLSTSDVSDDDLTNLITKAKADVEKDLGVSATILEEIDVLSGDPKNFLRTRIPTGRNGWYSVKLKKKPVLGIREVINDDTTLTVANLKFDKDRGRLWLTKNAADSLFDGTEKNTVRVRYLQGMFEPSVTARSKISGALSASATTVAITTDDDLSTGTVTIGPGDYVWIVGMNGNFEAAKVDSISSTTIVVDELNYAHSDDAIIAKLVENSSLDQLIRTVAGIYALHNVGGVRTGTARLYKMGEFQIEKDFKYKDLASDLIAERDRLFAQLASFHVIG